MGWDVKRIKLENKTHLEERNELPSTKGQSKVDFASSNEWRLPHRWPSCSVLCDVFKEESKKLKARINHPRVSLPSSFNIKTGVNAITRNTFHLEKFCENVYSGESLILS